jgi:hypothetical protein
MKRIALPALALTFCLSAGTAVHAAAPDGSRDFDFAFGTWHTQIRRIPHPFTGSSTWQNDAGTVTVRKLWNGAGSIEELEADGSAHLELLSVRMYDPKTAQWHLYGTNSADAELGDPMYGSFANGAGTFYDQEEVDGRVVLVRHVYFDVTSRSYRFEQALSSDGGATWQTNFTAVLTRTSKTAPSEGAATVGQTSHDFDFNYGTWSTHITTHSTAYTGTVTVRKIWNGRAFMEELKAGNASGGFEGATLFLYDPRTRQWSQTFASRDDGTFERSMVGGFTGGRGELVAYPAENDGRMELTREVWSDIKPGSHHFEIAFSRDGGATWRPDFIANLTRIGPGI